MLGLTGSAPPLPQDIAQVLRHPILCRLWEDPSMETQTIAAAAYHRFLRGLDYCPAWLALPVGIGAGVLGVAAALIWTPAVVGVALFVLLLGGAALLAWSGEPVAGLVEVPAPEPTMPGLEMIHIPGGVFRLRSRIRQVFRWATNYASIWTPTPLQT